MAPSVPNKPAQMTGTNPAVESTVSDTPVVSDTPAVTKPGVTDTPASPVTVAPVVTAPVAPIAPAPVAPVTPVSPVSAVQPSTKPIVTETMSMSTKSEFETYLADLRTGGTQFEQMFIRSLDAYMLIMAPGKPVAPVTGAKAQQALWKALQTLIDSAPHDQFTKLWTLWLGFVHLHIEGAFGERHACRFADQWIWDLDELDAYFAIINLTKLTCNPAERSQGLKRVSLDKTLARGFSEDGRQRIMSYYASV